MLPTSRGKLISLILLHEIVFYIISFILQYNNIFYVFVDQSMALE